MILVRQCTGLLLVVMLLFKSNSATAQFDGNFEIERHYLAIENFLDWKAYQPPISWKYEWALTPVGMQASVGSISMEEFYTYYDIRFTRDLGAWVSFYFNQTETSFYRKETAYQEVEFRFGKTYALSLIGFPSHDKKNAQMGYALSRGKRYSTSVVRISSIDQYFFYNEKNIDTEKNTRVDEYKKTPTFNRLELQFFSPESHMLQLDAKQVTKTELESENPQKTSTYESTGYSFTLDWIEQNSWILGISGYGHGEYREQIPESPAADNPDLKQDLMLQWLDLYFHTVLSEKNILTIGILGSKFNNQINSSFPESEYDCLFTTAQIYGVWKRKRSDWFQWVFSMQAGDAVLQKDYIGIEETIDDHTTELKAGVGVILTRQDNYRLFANTTWDLDIFQTRQWDGGNVQLQIVF